MRNPILHSFDHPVVGGLATHLEVLARQVCLGYAIHDLALGPELRHELARPEGFAHTRAATD